MMGMSWMGSERFKRVGNFVDTIIAMANSHWQHGMKQQPSTYYTRTP
jgi:hypothetical protein